MRNKSRFVLALVSFVLLSLIVGCAEPQAPTIQLYSTPTITGKVMIPAFSSVSPSDIYVKAVDSDGNTKSIQHVNADRSFVVQNLDSSKKYSLIFTSVAPDFENRAITRDIKENIEVGGIINNVVPATDLGQDVGTVRLKPLGTIKGKALIDGKEEHYDISVYIPGTSYIAKTDKDGSFSIYNVPEGTFTIRYVLNNYIPVMVDDVILVSESDTEGGVFTVKDVTLRSSLGTVQGKAKLGDASDSTGIAIHLESEDKSTAYDTTTTSDGCYVINDVVPGIYRVIASYSGYLSQKGDYFAIDPATVTNVADGIVLFSNVGTIKGAASLLNSDNKSGIVILIKDKNSDNSFSVLTDENGLFQKMIKPGEYTISANYSGYVSKSMDVTVLENSTTEASFTSLLPNSGTIEGKSNSPEEQVSLLYSDGTPVATVMSGQDCSYRFENVPIGTYSIKFSKTGFASFIASDIVITPTSIITVNGDELKSSFGSVIGTSSSEGETVSLLKNGTVVESVITTDNKSYSFTGIEPGEYTVRFSKEGYSSFESSMLTISSGSNLTINGDSLKSLYGTVAGFVNLDGSTDHSGVTITLTDSVTITSSRTETSASSGTYRFEGVPIGAYTLTISNTGYISKTINNVVVESGKITSLNLEKLTSAYGKISGMSDSVGETVSLLKGSSVINTVVSSDSKTYAFDLLEPGEYRVRFSKDGFSSYESDNVTVTAGSSFTINGGELVSIYGSVSGFVFLEGSIDYSGVTITLTNSTILTHSITVVSATDGSFRFEKLEKPGRYLLTYSKDGYVINNSKSVEVSLGSTSYAGEVTLKSTTSTIRGVVTLKDAVTHENISVLLKNDTNQYNTTTDQKGNYIINRVLPGTYTLIVSKDGFVTSQSSEIIIEPSCEKTLNAVSLDIAIRSVIGKVSLELKDDYSGALITATNLSDSTLVYSAISNSSGNYTLAGMKPGEYSVVISYNGYRTATISPTVNVISSTVIKIPDTNLSINRGTISGSVRLEGRSDSSGIKVELMRGSEVCEITTTDKSGNYSVYVPSGNYSGVRLSCEDFQSVTHTESISLFANNNVTIKSVTLPALNVSVFGKVDVLTTDDESGVTVSFENKNIASVVTLADGEFKFEHIPLGSYVLRFKRENCSDILIPVEISPSDGIEIDLVVLTPNTATIMGNVILKDSLSLDGVLVEVDMGSSKVSSRTDASGRYEIGGVSTEGLYKITWSKEGWAPFSAYLDSQLEKLEKRTLSDVTLNDSESPVINSLSINNLSSFTDNPKLLLKLSSSDKGSGVDKMSIQVIRITEGVESEIYPKNMLWQQYENEFEFALNDLPNSVYIGNSVYRLVVCTKDRAGNVSTPIEREITITNNATSLTGQLVGGNLHFTKERSPYIIEGNCTVAPEDKLIIDAGCEIRFGGNYSLIIAGEIEAIGTFDEPVIFTRSSSCTGYWRSVAYSGKDSVFLNDYKYQSGSIFKNCRFEYGEVPLALSSKIYVDNCYFDNNSRGLKITDGSVVVNSIIKDGVIINTADHRYAILYNNYIEDEVNYSYRSSSKMEYNTIKDAVYHNETSYFYDSSWCFANNILDNSKIEYSNYLDTNNCVFVNNAFKNYSGYLINLRNLGSHNCDVAHFEKNYWGKAQTEELVAKGSFTDISFIYDWFDDASIPRVDYSQWLDEEPAGIGFRGEDFDWDSFTPHSYE